MVACLLVRGVECRVSVRVLCVVLLFEDGHQRLRVNLGVLRLHVRCCVDVLLADGQQWLLRVLLVSTKRAIAMYTKCRVLFFLHWTLSHYSSPIHIRTPMIKMFLALIS